MGTIFDTLKNIGVASEETKIPFAFRTRDNPDLMVWQDSKSKVIYIDEFYVGDREYESGQYREDKKSEAGSEISEGSYEDITDTNKRLSDHKQLYVGKSICDVGCGEGSFLLGAQRLASLVSGVDLQSSYVSSLAEKGISCEKSILDHKNNFESVFMFHSLEHFVDPLAMLGDVRQKMSLHDSKLIVEVPHANDFLISTLKCGEFIDFTLWSQHLILHTRESLRRLLKVAGFSHIMIEGRQRYGISNHLTWLNEKRPGGHTSPLSSFETDQLKSAYEGALQKIDATDTLVAIAEY